MRRQRDVNKLNMSKMIKMWIERGKCDGKGENIKGNALLADFTHFLTLASREFVVSLLKQQVLVYVNLGVHKFWCMSIRVYASFCG